MLVNDLLIANIKSRIKNVSKRMSDGTEVRRSKELKLLKIYEFLIHVLYALT